LADDEEHGLRVNVMFAGLLSDNIEAFGVRTKTSAPERTDPASVPSQPVVGLKTFPLPPQVPQQWLLAFWSDKKVNDDGTVTLIPRKQILPTTPRPDFAHTPVDNDVHWTVTPTQSGPTVVDDDIGPLSAPFFFSDNRHTFFVTPTVNERVMDGWDTWAIPI